MYKWRVHILEYNCSAMLMYQYIVRKYTSIHARSATFFPYLYENIKATRSETTKVRQINLILNYGTEGM